MKLLFVLPEYGPSFKQGIATFYNHLLPGFLTAGCAVDVCLPWEQEIPSDLPQQSGVRIFGVDPALVQNAKADLSHFTALPELHLPLARALAAFRSCDGGRGYDVIETTDYGLLFVPWLLREAGPPIVVQLHSSYGQLDYYEPHEGSGLWGLMARLLETSLLSRADELQTYGPENGKEWSRLLNKEVHHIWPAWHPGHTADITQLPRELNAEGCGVVVARIRGWKGPELLCQAIELLGDRAPRILWVGADHRMRRDGSSMSTYLKGRYGNVWEKTVLPVGELPRGMTASVQATAKFVVVPSHWDTFNLAAAEAMWANKVIVCSEAAGASSLIRHGENGFRFPADDPQQLADLLAEVDQLTPERRYQIGQNAHQTIACELDLDRVCATRIDHYRRLKENKSIVRGQNRWIDSLFASENPEPPFDFLSVIPTRHLTKWALKRAWQKLRSVIH